MNFIKKQSIGFYLSVMTMIFAIVGICMYFAVDPSFSSFLKSENSGAIIACTVIALIAEIAYVVLSQIAENRLSAKARMLLAGGVCLLITVLLALALVNMLMSGAYELGMALGSALGDKTTANFFIVVIVMEVIALAFCMASAFFKIVKE